MLSLRKEFDSAEHDALGTVKLQGLPDNFSQFTLPNGVKVTFGDIIALAGDYYGVPEQPICLGKTPADQRKRFRAALKTLTHADPSSITSLLNMIKKERETIDSALTQGTSVPDALSKLTTKETLEALDYTKGKYLELADRNLDHFNAEASVAYQTGHMLAMRIAMYAHQFSNPVEKQTKLEQAYMVEAFACHFLTDHFATGHIRTPRAALENKFGPQIGSLLSLFQHNEDGDNGLVVANKHGDKWRAFGDGHLFEVESKENKAKALEAVQTAADEIFQAFHDGNGIHPNESAVLKLIPEATDNNYSPMFMVNANKQLMFRSDLNDKNCNHYLELTREHVLTILDHFAEQYCDDADIQKKMTAIRKSFAAEESKIENDIKHWKLPFFNHKKTSAAQNSSSNGNEANHRKCTIL